MNNLALISFAVLALAQLLLPRRYAALPLIITFACMTRGPILEIGELGFSMLRLTIVLALARAVFSGLRPARGINGVDWLLFNWAVWMFASAWFHHDPRFAFRLGLIWDFFGSYAVLRIYVQNGDDVRLMFKMMAWALLPTAILMTNERISGINLFALMGEAVPPALRENGFRANGPFAHALLAGTVGATLVPISAAMWRGQRKLALFATLVGMMIILAAASSSPLMMLLMAAIVLLLWPLRRFTRWFLALSIFSLIFLNAVMHDPVYFLVARIDIVGGSTGWHRAQLIRASLDHFGDWWFAGTDYTRNWMPTGIAANDQYTDITNHFLQQGVFGGMLLMTLFIFAIFGSMRFLSRAANADDAKPSDAFLAWTLLAILSAHALNFFAVSLFDQSIVSFLMVLAAAGAMRVDPVAMPAAKQLQLQSAKNPVHHRYARHPGGAF